MRTSIPGTSSGRDRQRKRTLNLELSVELLELRPVVHGFHMLYVAWSPKMRQKHSMKVTSDAGSASLLILRMTSSKPTAGMPPASTTTHAMRINAKRKQNVCATRSVVGQGCRATWERMPRRSGRGRRLVGEVASADVEESDPKPSPGTRRR